MTISLNNRIQPSKDSKTSQPWLVRWSQTLLLKLLNNLDQGHLTLVHSQTQTQYSFGDRSASLQATIYIDNEQFYPKALFGGSIGAAESYMQQHWRTDNLTQVIQIMVRNMAVLDQVESKWAWLTTFASRCYHYFNRNSLIGSEKNIGAHYDLSNDFFKLFLDPRMMYSSARFTHPNQSLADAQTHKLDLICQKLALRPQDHVIEIGTGWGGFALYAAQHYGCRVTTTTISQAQHDYAAQAIEAAGLTEQITLLKQDYRTLSGQYDKLVSIEMVEAVGWQYFDTYYQTCSALLKPNGLMLIQGITILDQRYDHAKRNADFIQRYIFPGSCIPSIHALTQSMKQKTDLRLVDLEDFGEDYALTLRRWREQFEHNTASIQAMGLPDSFLNMWRFYLCYCEGGFLEHSIGVSHFLYAKPKAKRPNFLS